MPSSNNDKRLTTGQSKILKIWIHISQPFGILINSSKYEFKSVLLFNTLFCIRLMNLSTMVRFIYVTLTIRITVERRNRFFYGAFLQKPCSKILSILSSLNL